MNPVTGDSEALTVIPDFQGNVFVIQIQPNPDVIGFSMAGDII
jgi:hypothetical protein